MTELIEIPTTRSIFNLYMETSNNLDFYKKHLDLSEYRATQIDLILEKHPDFRENESFENLYTQLEFNGLLIISVLDLSLISREFFISKKPWENIFYAKQAYLVIYETINCYNKHTKNLKYILSKLAENLNNEFQNISKTIRKFKKDYNFLSEFSDIRNKVVGHIDDNFRIYCSTLKTIDIPKTQLMLKDFILILTSLQNFSSNLLKEYGKLQQGNLKLIDEQHAEIMDKINNTLNSNNR